MSAESLTYVDIYVAAGGGGCDDPADGIEGSYRLTDLYG